MGLPKFRGVVPIVAVPFSDDGSLVPSELEAEVRWLADLGVQGFGIAIASELFALGKDWDTVVSTVVATADGLPVVASVGVDDTAKTVARATRAAEHGASAVMAFPPRGRQLSAEELVDYYSQVGQVGIDVWVQDAPQLTGVEMPIETVAALASIEAIRGWKIEAHPTPEKVAAVREVVGPDVTILGGAGGFAFPAELAVSAEGTMPGATACPTIVAEWKTHEGGDTPGAGRIHEAARPMWEYAKENVASFVHMQKVGLVAAGIFSTDTCRIPTERLDEEQSRHWLDLLGALV